MNVQGPYHYQGDLHPSFNVWDDHGIVATVYAYDGDIEVAKLRADRLAASPLLLAALRDMLAGWHYIREHHGDLYGVGWDRCEQAAVAAIAAAEGETS